VSIEQIAVAADMAYTTPHHYFRGKDEILRGAHETFIDVLLERNDQCQQLGLSPAMGQLGAMTDIDGLMETHCGHAAVFFEHYRDPPAAGAMRSTASAATT
jgi:TetR/AcrR family transcriptional regulator, cholesterol catabolism regulator